MIFVASVWFFCVICSHLTFEGFRGVIPGSLLRGNANVKNFFKAHPNAHFRGSKHYHIFFSSSFQLGPLFCLDLVVGKFGSRLFLITPPENGCSLFFGRIQTPQTDEFWNPPPPPSIPAKGPSPNVHMNDQTDPQSDCATQIRTFAIFKGKRVFFTKKTHQNTARL